MQLAVFPENGLASSVIPPVFVGLTFSTLFAEALGWNFSGLIVPGYLAPIFAVKPVSGIIIIIEALITYVILRILSDGFSKFGIWTRFFGQDAFFSLFCISILVKSAMEGPLLPFLGEFANSIIPGGIDYRNEFHSTGLIVVPLLANIFWRHGLRRNLFPAVSVIGLTFLVTQYLLIPYTNFSVNKFELLYSKMALNFEESPLFYIILLVGTAMASHNKYRFGWAYHGMLIPALLGIAWLTPFKIITTFIEAGLILIIGRWITRLRIMRNVTIEGPRKLHLMFSIGFLLKMVTGFVLQEAYPGFQATDLYGFAYILPALLAMEMWPGRYFVKVARVTIQTSFLAAVIGIGISLIFQPFQPGKLSQPEIFDRIREQVNAPEVYSVQTGNLLRWVNKMADSRINWGVNHEPLPLKRFSAMDRKIFVPLISHLEQGLSPNELKPIITELKKTGFQLVEFTDESLDERFYVLLERGNSEYRGMFVFRIGDSDSVVIQVPQPLNEFQTLEMGLELFRDLNAKALFISGTSRRKQFAEFDVTHLESRQSIFQLAHQVIHRESIESDPVTTIQIRGASELIGIDADAVLSTGKEVRNLSLLPESLQNIVNQLRDAGMRIHLFCGNEADKRFSTWSNAQQAYVDSFNMGFFSVLWVSPELRSCYKYEPLSDQLANKLNWNTATISLKAWVKQHSDSSFRTSSDLNQPELTTGVFKELEDFHQTANVRHLSRINEIVSQNNCQVTLIKDSSRLLDFLAISPESPATGPAIIFNFAACVPETLTIRVSDIDESSILNSFCLMHYQSLIIMGDQQ